MQPLFEHRPRIDGYETRALELEGVGHCPQLEATERLLELLLPFAVAEAA